MAKKSFTTSSIWAFLLSNFSNLFRMLRSYINGSYKVIPYRSLFKIAVGLFYIFFILDLVPDFIPIAGWLDDIAVSAWILSSVRKDIQQFRTYDTRE